MDSIKPRLVDRWSLGFDACIVILSTFFHVEEYLAASGSPPRMDKTTG